jgi:hypothetical protein
MKITALLSAAIVVVGGCQKTSVNDGPVVAATTTSASLASAGAAATFSIEESFSCGLRARLRQLPSLNASSQPRFELALTNRGAHSLKLVLPGEGSTEGMRTPDLTWTAIDEEGDVIDPVNLRRCGRINPVDASEVFTLAPGATRTISGAWMDPAGFDGGPYELSLRYKNDPSRYALDDEREGRRALAATNACDVTSNTLRDITF